MGNSQGGARIAPQEAKMGLNAAHLPVSTAGIEVHETLAPIAIPWRCLRLGTKLNHTHDPWICINKSWCIGPNYMTRVIIKQVDGYCMDAAAFGKEVALMRHLHHPNLVQFHGVTWHGANSYVVTECTERGDLRQCLQGEPSLVENRAVVLNLLQDIAAGMDYLHTNNIVHRDLHSGNVHVSEDLRAKIANFECNRYKTVSQPPPPWVAPEIVAGGEWTDKADVYSFAILMAEVLSGNGKAEVTTELIDLYTQCLARDPTRRPSFAAIATQLEKIRTY